MTLQLIKAAIAGITMVLAEHLRELTTLRAEQREAKKQFMVGYLAHMHDSGALDRAQIISLNHLIHSEHLYPTLRYAIYEEQKW